MSILYVQSIYIFVASLILGVLIQSSTDWINEWNSPRSRRNTLLQIYFVRIPRKNLMVRISFSETTWKNYIESIRTNPSLESGWKQKKKTNSYPAREIRSPSFERNTALAIALGPTLSRRCPEGSIKYRWQEKSRKENEIEGPWFRVAFKGFRFVDEGLAVKLRTTLAPKAETRLCS